MVRRADVVVIGGGVVGCAIAYNLARLGAGKVVLLEKGYLASGATGRCGAGVRMQWGTAANCLLARESVRMFEHLPELLDVDGDIEFAQGGYLLLAYTEKMAAQFRANLALQSSLGIPARWVTPAEAREIVPHLSADDLLGAAYCPEDGHCNPFAVTALYAEAARRLGVEVNTYTEVTGIEVRGGRVRGVATTAGAIATPAVVNAAGGHARLVGRLAGVELPIYPERHEILVTEPVEPLQRPMVMSFHHNLYCQQTPHGSFIMGVGHPGEPEGINHRSSWQFLSDVAAKATAIMPRLAALNVVRQWAGVYDMSPDRQPILGEDAAVKGFFTAAGFSGHGFMIAPMTGQLVAELVTGRATSLDVGMFAAERFARGELFVEPSVV